MDRYIRIAAFVANTGMIVAAAFIFANAYRFDQRLLAALLFLPPVLSICALRNSPDKEERDLAKSVRKARLRRELKDLQ